MVTSLIPDAQGGQPTGGHVRWRDVSTAPDPERDAKLGRIEEVVDRFPDPVFAFG